MIVEAQKGAFGGNLKGLGIQYMENGPNKVGFPVSEKETNTDMRGIIPSTG